MVDRVVEHPGPALLPLAHLVADAKAAFAGYEQRQMHDQASVDQSVVWRDVRTRLQLREQHRRRAPGNPCERRSGQCGHRPRTARRVGFVQLAVLPEIKRGPRGIVGHPHLLRVRAVRVASHVRREGSGVLQHALQLRTDVVRRRLDRIEPREVRAVVELLLRQLREIEISRLLQVDALAPDQDVECLAKATAGPRFIEATRLEPRAHVVFIAPGEQVTGLLRAAQLLQQVGR